MEMKKRMKNGGGYIITTRNDLFRCRLPHRLSFSITMVVQKVSLNRVSEEQNTCVVNQRHVQQRNGKRYDYGEWTRIRMNNSHDKVLV